MSGDHARNDDDFLDDDFVIEDLAGKNDDLERLFQAGNPADAAAAPAPGTPAKPGAAKPDKLASGAAPADADDVLFDDHTRGLNPSERFQGGDAFAEEGKSNWRGEGLELDEVGVPPAPESESQMAAAEASFTEELGALLQNEDEFGLDSEKDLELVDAPSPDGISEIEQSGPFVLDDGEGAWQAETPAEDEAVTSETAGDEVAEEVVADAEETAAEPALVADDAPVEPGWEPLPEANMDALAEVDDLAHTGADGEAVAAEPATLAGEAAADVDGHDIYTEEEAAPVLVGPRAASPHRLRHLLGALAASLALVSAAAVVVMRPEWLGLAYEPARIEQVRVERPDVRVTVETPAVVAAVPPANTTDPVASPAGTGTGNDPNAGTGTTVPVIPVVPTPDVPTPDVPAPPPDAGTGTTQPQTNGGEPTTPVVIEPTPVEPSPVATSPAATTETPATSWPVAVATPAETPNPASERPPLMRVGNNVMLGEMVDDKSKVVRAVDGVLPGARAFAQLHNGNYFIGSVKVATPERLTLRVNEGEVTLAADEIARLTQLGSADYDALQRATSGFIRLTNNNRLVGGILSQIADDHIVLEFRSNRVMLPKSAIGKVVQGENTDDVRLDVTREEDDWLRGLAERELGTGKGAAMPSKATGTSAEPTAGKSAGTVTPPQGGSAPAATSPARPAPPDGRQR